MPRKIKIGEMSVTTTKATMDAAFDDHGTIVRSSIDINPANGQSLGIGHIEYTTEQAGTDAIAARHNTVFDGATISVTEDR